MLCKDTLMMVGGGLLAGYGVAQTIGEKKPFSKVEAFLPLIGGIALLGFGYMNYSKSGGGKMMGGGYGMMAPESMSMPEVGSGPMLTPLSTSKPLKVMANYAGINPTQAIIKSSGNASYDKNHVYPGII